MTGSEVSLSALRAEGCQLAPYNQPLGTPSVELQLNRCSPGIRWSSAPVNSWGLAVGPGKDSVASWRCGCALHLIHLSWCKMPMLWLCLFLVVTHLQTYLLRQWQYCGGLHTYNGTAATAGEGLYRQRHLHDCDQPATPARCKCCMFCFCQMHPTPSCVRSLQVRCQRHVLTTRAS
jgi:hypothetical protein